jgi:hypothetical protein
MQLVINVTSIPDPSEAEKAAIKQDLEGRL